MDTLPDELLVKIFSFFTWPELSTLSLVNRRWYRAAGSAPFVQSVFLTLSKAGVERDGADSSHIDDRILTDSKRQYSGVSCSLCATGDTLIGLAVLGRSFEVCLERWKIRRLRIVGQYDQVLVFFQRYGSLLERIVELSVVLEQISSRNHYEKNDQGGCTVVLERLRRFSWVERSLPNLLQPQPYSFAFVVPQLQQMKVHRIERSKADNLMLYDCTGLKVVDISSCDLLGSSLFDSDCTALEELKIGGIFTSNEHLRRKSFMLRRLTSIDLSGCDQGAINIVSQYSTDLKVLQLSSPSGWIHFDRRFQQLSEVRLKFLSLWPENALIGCPNLKKLTILNASFKAPLKLRAPLLDTLVVDELALRYVQLEDGQTVQKLGISKHHEVHTLPAIRLPVYPNVTELHFELSAARAELPDTIDELNSYQRVSKLTVVGASYVSIDQFTEFLHNFPFLESLHLHSIHYMRYDPDNWVRDYFNFKRLLITDSTMEAESVTFLSNAEWVRFYRVQIRGGSGSSGEDLPFAEQLSPPLVPEEHRELAKFIPVTVNSYSNYSSRGFRFDESGELLKW